jgi:hypothetical protein
MKKLLLVAVLVLVLAFAMIGPALAHNIIVTTPSGQENCQFLGGPGNPGHPGHANGHATAIGHEQSETAQMVGGAPCWGGQ